MEFVTASYPGTDASLYAVALFMCQSCLDNIDLFAALKAIYTPLFVQDIIDSSEAARALPNQSQRKSEFNGVYSTLWAKAGGCFTNYNMLIYYIGQAFPADVVNDKRLSAGASFYTDATHGKWVAVSTLNAMMTSFIDDNSAALTAAGMSEDFPATCDDADAAFAAALVNYNGIKNANQKATIEKITANNAVYARLVSLMKDGKFIFRNDPVEREQFNYAAVLRSTRKAGKTGFRIEVMNKATNEPIANAHLSFTNSSVTKVSNAKGIILFEMAEGKYNYIISATGYSTQVGSITAKKGVVRRPKIDMTAGAGDEIITPVTTQRTKEKAAR